MEPSEYLPGPSDNVGVRFIAGHSTQQATGSDLNVDRLLELPSRDEVGEEVFL